MVVRRGFTHDLAELLMSDLERVLPRLERQAEPIHTPELDSAFKH